MPLFPDLDPAPDFSRLATVFARGVPDRVPFIEFYLDLAVVGVTPSGDDARKRWKETAEAWLRLGYDGFPVGASYALPKPGLQAPDTAAISHGMRHWRDENRGAIETWDDFEKYPWPRSQDIDYRALEAAASVLPDGMGLIGADPGGARGEVRLAKGLYRVVARGEVTLADGTRQPFIARGPFVRVGE